jgi:small subunit ribosomal protein S8
MLTVIRNGVMAEKDVVNVPHSKIKVGICQVLVDEGYIRRFDVLDTQPAKTIKVALKYGPEGEHVIREIKRVSKPGCRVYRSRSELKPIIHGYGISIVSTSKGVLSDRACHSGNIGGEVLCTVK